VAWLALTKVGVTEALTCFTSAIVSILTDDGFSVPTAGAERCLDLANNSMRCVLKKPIELMQGRGNYF